jgi:hypothetical protein
MDDIDRELLRSIHDEMSATMRYVADMNTKAIQSFSERMISVETWLKWSVVLLAAIAGILGIRPIIDSVGLSM